MKLDDFLSETRTQFESALRTTFPNPQSKTLKTAIHYSLLDGGKRLRPALVRAAYIASKQKAASKHTTDSEHPDDGWLTAAIALEMIHVYSLIHDDLPAMDDDDLRRGKPTSHKAFNEATAILTGDALLTEAFGLIARDTSLSDAQARQMSITLSDASGYNGMVGGQMLDLQAERREIPISELETIHRLKTAALIQAALKMGALSSQSVSTDLLDSLNEYGLALGLAFQITDDVLDVTSSTEVLGKTQGSDEIAQKSTYVSLLKLGGAQQKALEQFKLASTALEKIELNEQSILWQLADYVVTRDH